MSSLIGLAFACEIKHACLPSAGLGVVALDGFITESSFSVRSITSRL